ncbi:MAG: MATE family efflux transporter, partial [Gemmiger sp.]
MKQQQFYRMVWSIALPVTLQSLLQSSFSVVDQLMIGQLGSVSIAGVGLGGKFASIYSVLISAVAAVAGILMAQYLGRGEHRQASSAFFSNLLLGCGLAVLFTVVCLVAPQRIMAAYTTDAETRMAAACYLRILSLSFLPAAVTSVLAALLRCAGAAALPLYASLLASGANTVLNNLLIFGRFGLPALGVQGAAWASVTAQYLGCAASLILWRTSPKRELRLEPVCRLTAEGWRQYWGILAPMLACELLWSLGENVYAMIYGRLGTAACAAMTLTNPVQMLMTGALSGVSQAAGVLIGRTLGEGDMTRAYRDSKRLLALGLGGSVALCLLLTAVRGRYVAFYQVEEPVHLLAAQILL